MIILDKEVVFINWYLQEKEYFYTDHVREALNLVHFYIVKKKQSRASAIHKVNEKFKKDYGFDFSKPFLWKLFRQRKAHIRNAKEEFKQYEIQKRIERAPKTEIKLCKCGCGLPVKPGNKYINGHNPRFKNEQEKIEYTKNLRDIKQGKKEKVIYFKKI